MTKRHLRFSLRAPRKHEENSHEKSTEPFCLSNFPKVLNCRVSFFFTASLCVGDRDNPWKMGHHYTEKWRSNLHSTREIDYHWWNPFTSRLSRSCLGIYCCPNNPTSWTISGFPLQTLSFYGFLSLWDIEFKEQWNWHVPAFAGPQFTSSTRRSKWHWSFFLVDTRFDWGGILAQTSELCYRGVLFSTCSNTADPGVEHWSVWIPRHRWEVEIEIFRLSTSPMCTKCVWRNGESCLLFVKKVWVEIFDKIPWHGKRAKTIGELYTPNSSLPLSSKHISERKPKSSFSFHSCKRTWYHFSV